MLTWVVVAKNRLYETIERNLVTFLLPKENRKPTFWSKSVKEMTSFGIFQTCKFSDFWNVLQRRRKGWYWNCILLTYLRNSDDDLRTLSASIMAAEATKSSLPDISASSRHGTFQFGFRLNRLLCTEIHVRKNFHLLLPKKQNLAIKVRNVVHK